MIFSLQRKWAPAAIALTMLAFPAHGSVVKCQGPDGRITYQDKSCDHGARGAPVDTTPNMGAEFATRQQIDKAMRSPADDAPPPRARTPREKVHKPLNAAERRFLKTGMYASEVRRKYGPPDQIARPMTADGTRQDRNASQQWIYLPADEDPQTTTVVTVRRGLVLHVDRRVTR